MYVQFYRISDILIFFSLRNSAADLTNKVSVLLRISRCSNISLAGQQRCIRTSRTKWAIEIPNGRTTARPRKEEQLRVA